MDNSRILEKAKCVYKHLKPYCTAIYLGGSLTQKYINNPHDIDFICFSDNEMDRLKMNILLNSYISKHKSEFDEKDDFIQTRNREHEEHAYGSYVHKDMILLCGKEVEFNFDIINKDRKEYINILKCAMKEAKQIILSDDNKSKELVKALEKSIESSNNFLCFN